MRLLSSPEDGLRSSRDAPRAVHDDLPSEQIAELQRAAGNHAVAAALGASRPTGPVLQRARQFADRAIDDWVTENPPNEGETRPDYLTRAVPLFKAEFPYCDHTDVAYARRRMQGHGAPRAAPPALAFAGTFDAHLDGGHFGNGGAGYHIYNTGYIPPTVQQQNGQPRVAFGATYDGGARPGTVHRAAGGTVPSTFFPDGWTTATVRAEIARHWANLRQLHGLVHVITRGRNRFAICVNVTGNQVVSAFPARRGPGGRWTD